MSNASQPNRICSSLGLLNDENTLMDFPSNGNFCHRSLPVASPRFNHQREFCLGGKHVECPLFLSQHAIPMPQELQSLSGSSATVGNKFSRNLAVGLMVILFVLMVSWWGITRRAALPAVVSEKETPTATVSSAMSTKIVTSTAAVTALAEPSLTLAILPANTLSKHQLDMLIGSDTQFVIHQIMEGETLDIFAEKYNTNIESIVNVTRGLTPTGVWTNTLIVIPVEVIDASHLPSFVVYQVKEIDRGISIQSLAEKLKVDPLDLKYYNGWINDGDRPLVGDYVLVPRIRVQP